MALWRFWAGWTHQVKVRGYRVEPAEVARVPQEQPDVAQAEVVARSRKRGLKVQVDNNVLYKVHFFMTDKQLPARFFESDTGRIPVRDWLLELSDEDRKAIGDDIRTAEFGWPIGMPLCRSIQGHKGLWEIRIKLAGGRIARVFFCVHDSSMVLLHGFIKKSQKTPAHELDVAVKRVKGLEK